MRSVSAGSLDIRDIFPDVMMGAHKDYELIRVDERQEEDIVSISTKLHICAPPSGLINLQLPLAQLRFASVPLLTSFHHSRYI